MKYLVTGGAGFIGSNLVRSLIKEDHEVVVFDDFSTGSKKNLEGVNLNVFKDCISKYSAVKNACKDVDVIFHLASMVSVPESIENPLKCHEVISKGTLNVLKAALDNGVKKIVYSSSSAVYGDAKEFPITENSKCKPLTPYGLEKLHSEQLCELFHDLYGLNYSVLRYFNVFGPRQNPKGAYAAVVPLFISKLLKGKSPEIYGNGEQTRDFIHVDNIIQANITASKSKSVGTYNIAEGNPTSVLSLLENLNKLLKTNVEAKFLPERKGDIKHSYADVSDAKYHLGFKPKISFYEGLKNTLEWYKK